MTARVGVVQFPGTNCELDIVHVVERLGSSAEILWHGDESTKGVDAVVVPGGFAHGDYLRTGAIARFSPVMGAVAEFAAGKLTADYMDLTDLTLIDDWKKRGILASHKVPSFDKIAPELKDKDGYWYSTVRAIQTIAVNTEMVKEADYPKSWAETFEPKWKGKFCTRSGQYMYSNALFAAYLAHHGEEKTEAWLRGSHTMTTLDVVAKAAPEPLPPKSPLTVWTPRAVTSRSSPTSAAISSGIRDAASM